MNTLYYGDNLDILRRYVKDESVDLVYLDPPFKSNQDYNVLFAERSGEDSAAQIKAFEDTWQWDQGASAAYHEIVEQGPFRVSKAMQAFWTFLGPSDMMAYLAMMAPRLVELRRVLKRTGSIYLHCDPTASHYLKMLMDSIFGPLNFRNEIAWRRTATHGKSLRYAPIHDTILLYTKAKEHKWNYPRKPYMRKHVEQYFVQDEKGWKTAYYGNVLTGSGLRGGESGKPWRGFDPSAKGRHWAIPSSIVEDSGEDMSDLTQHEKLDRLFELGYITILPGEAWPIYEHRLKPEYGQNVPDIWAFQPYTERTVFGTDAGIDEDVRWLSPQDQERLGYQTQKPEGILQRIIEASSDPGDVVLDPFCGCGTTIAVAQRLKRQWIGIDITQAAIVVIKDRLTTRFGKRVKYGVIGEPVSVPDAEALAKQDRFQFQWWALGLVGARPTDQKKGADRGIDGRLYFHDDPKDHTKQIVISVKSGSLAARDVRDLVGVVTREKASIGALLTLEPPTKPMRRDAASLGFYQAPFGKKYPRLQILTIAELLEGKTLEFPHENVTFKKAAAHRPVKESQIPLAPEPD